MTSDPELLEDDYSVEIVRAVCALAGIPSYVDDLRAQLRANGVIAAVNNHDTPRLFDWLGGSNCLSFFGRTRRH